MLDWVIFILIVLVISIPAQDIKDGENIWKKEKKIKSGRPLRK